MVGSVDEVVNALADDFANQGVFYKIFRSKASGFVPNSNDLDDLMQEFFLITVLEGLSTYTEPLPTHETLYEDKNFGAWFLTSFSHHIATTLKQEARRLPKKTGRPTNAERRDPASKRVRPVEFSLYVSAEKNRDLHDCTTMQRVSLELHRRSELYRRDGSGRETLCSEVREAIELMSPSKRKTYAVYR